MRQSRSTKANKKTNKKTKKSTSSSAKPLRRRYGDEPLRHVFDLSSDLYWEQDEKLRFTHFSGRPLSTAKIDTSEFIGKTRWEISGIKLDAETRAALQAKFDAHEPYDLEYQRVRPDGSVRHLVTSGMPMFDDDGRFTGYRGIARDVTEHLQKELRLSIEHGVTRILAEANSIAEAAPQIIRLFCETLGWSCGARWVPDELGEAIRCGETWGTASAEIDAFLESTRLQAPSAQLGGLNRRAWSYGGPLWIEDVTEEPSFRRAPDALKAGLRSAFAFPIKIGAQSIGVMEFFSREIHQPDTELLDGTRYIGSQIGQFMERKRAEDEQLRFRAAVDASVDLILLVDPGKLQYIDTNETACRELGYSREELLAMGPPDIYSVARDDLSQFFKRLIAGDLSTATHEVWYRRKDGSRFLVEGTRRAVRTANGHIIVAVARDITARRRAEQLLKLEHTVTRSLANVDSASAALTAAIRAVCETENWESGGYWYVDDEAGVLRSSDFWCAPHSTTEEFYKKNREVTFGPGIGMVGHVWQSAQPLWVADINTDSHVLQTALVRETGMGSACLFPVLAQGRVIGVLAFVSREIREPDERLLAAVRAIGSQIGQFIKRKQAEAALGEGEERFRGVVDSANEGILVYDRSLRVLSGNAAAERLIGLPLADIIGAAGFTSLLPCVREDGSPFRPEDRPTRKSVREDKPLANQIIGIKRPDGSVTWLAVNTGFLRRPGESDYYGVVSTFGDVSRQRQAEEELRTSEARFRSLTNLSSDWFWQQDAKLRFTQLEGRHVTGDSSAFKNELGKTFEEIGVEIESGWETHRALMEAHQPFRDIVMWHTTQNGERYHVSMSGEPMFDNESRFIGYRGIARDITERKRGEQLLALEHAVNRCVAEATSASDGIKASIRAVCETEGWACGRYFRVDGKAGVLRFADAWNVPGEEMDRFMERSREIRYAPGDGLLGRVWQSAQPLLIADIAKDPRIRAGVARDLGMHGSFLFPVLSEGRTIGVLSFHSRHVREPEARLLRAIDVVGRQIGQFVSRKQAEQATLRLGRMFAALSATNDAILHAESREDLYRQVCDAAVDGGKFSNTTILMCETGTSRLIPVASVGEIQKFVLNSHVSSDETIKEGQGLVGTAFRTQRPCVTNDYLNDERTRPWQNEERNPSCRSAAALPLIHGDHSIGALLIHDKELNAFDDEITMLLERMAANVSYALANFEHEAERREAQERIEYLATHDGLTNLPNRVLFSQLLNLTIKSAQRFDRRFAVLFLDLDRFKIINDTLGHEAGDLLLQEMAGRIKDSLRASDVVARLGGDEFVVLLQEVTEPEQVSTVARKLLSNVIKPVVILGHECRVTASIGISMFPADACDEQSLMKNADMAMYHAKEEGKNNFQFYPKDFQPRSIERLTLEASLRHALEREEFFLDYQAKLDLGADAISGVEALLRWQHPDLGIVSPAQFIPLAEETGLIVSIGKWVLRHACAQNVAWQQAGLPPVCMAVNLSPRQFADEHLLSDIAAALAETGMKPELLELEITESMVMGNIERAAKQLTAIKQMGVRLAIDDFGTGYSSLAEIKRFPIDTIKVDRSFIRELPLDVEDKAITQAIIALGKSLGLTVVAEGVETEQQQTFLEENACNEIQGFYFSRPVAPDKFAELLRTHVSHAKQLRRA